jgi:hypothetical protein
MRRLALASQLTPFPRRPLARPFTHAAPNAHPPAQIFRPKARAGCVVRIISTTSEHSRGSRQQPTDLADMVCGVASLLELARERRHRCGYARARNTLVVVAHVDVHGQSPRQERRTRRAAVLLWFWLLLLLLLLSSSSSSSSLSWSLWGPNAATRRPVETAAML